MPNSDELILGMLVEAGDDFLPGAALCDKLGLSNSAVFKHLEGLRRLGYRIETSSTRGFRLIEVPDRLTSLEVAPYLFTRDIGRTIHFEETTESTNALAMSLANDGAQHGDVVIADQQTSGRGRRGRRWESPAHKNLYCSVILRPDLPKARAGELTLVAAVALADTLRESGVDAQIKWPNDVLANGKKLAGVLCELSSADDETVVVMGLGVNLNAEPADFSDEVRALATSVRVERKQVVSRPLFTAALFSKLEDWLDVHANEGFEAIRRAWKERATTIGQEVLVRTDSKETRGVALDLDETGALLLKTATGTERIVAGDVEHVKAKKST